MSTAEDKNVVQVPSLSLVVNERALADMNAQRIELNQFISKCLVEGVDYGTIPGTPKPSLYKPGAEKLAKLFKLGSRIVDRARDLDMEKGWALFSYTVEVFHLPTGQMISQCEGSANKHEKKYKCKKDGTPIPLPDVLNTLQKMAQKRAYVGAVIIATGASDFFTQDVEDMDLGGQPQPAHRGNAPEVSGEQALGDYVPKFGRYASSKMPLSEIPEQELRKYMQWLREDHAKTKKDPSQQAREFMQVATAYLQEEYGR